MSRRLSTLSVGVISIALLALGCNTEPAAGLWIVEGRFDTLSTPAPCSTGICRTSASVTKSFSGRIIVVSDDSATATLDGVHYHQLSIESSRICLLNTDGGAGPSFCVAWEQGAARQAGSIQWQNRGAAFPEEIYTGTFTATKRP